MKIKNFWTKSNAISKNMRHYDHVVNNINCERVWRCSQQYIMNHYRNYISSYHLEIGPGTGYFLENENIRKANSIEKITLVDINSEILEYASENLQYDYSRISTVNCNLFKQTLPTHIKFDSVGLNYVLHCVPGNLEDKVDTLLHNLDHTDYNLFGATVICDPLHMNPIAEYELTLLNSLGIFHNEDDTYDGLVNYLEKNNIRHNSIKRGYVALFNIEV